MTPEDAFAALADEFRGRAGVGEARRFNSPSLTVDGRIFVMLVRSRIVLKLPADRCRELVEAGTAEPFVMGKRTMREWIRLVGAPSADSLEPVRSLAAEALAFVR